MLNILTYTPESLNALAAEGTSALTRCDELYEQSLRDAAEALAQSSLTHPIILLAGPSGSGKTTTAHKLEKYLDNMGHEAHTVSMDNYFYRRADGFVPRDEEGNQDFESPLNLDMELFARHTAQMARCERVEMPTFDFVNQRRARETVTVERKKGEIIIFEGIHALNPEVLSDQSFSRRIYICPAAEVLLPDGRVVSQQHIRLLRRLMRDKVHRGSSFDDTLRKFGSVCRGERLFIDPYRDNADLRIDTFLPYELGVYAGYLRDSLKGASPELISAAGADAAIELLNMLNPIEVADVSRDSLIQEFLAL